VQDLLDDPAPRRRAEAIAGAMAALPPVDDAVEVLARAAGVAGRR